jgi:hypothetical protein
LVFVALKTLWIVSLDFEEYILVAIDRSEVAALQEHVLLPFKFRFRVEFLDFR